MISVTFQRQGQNVIMNVMFIIMSKCLIIVINYVYCRAAGLALTSDICRSFPSLALLKLLVQVTIWAPESH